MQGLLAKTRGNRYRRIQEQPSGQLARTEGAWTYRIAVKSEWNWVRQNVGCTKIQVNKLDGLHFSENTLLLKMIRGGWTEKCTIHGRDEIYIHSFRSLPCDSSDSTSPLILNPCIRRVVVVIFTLRPLYTQCPLTSWLGELQSLYRRFIKKKNLQLSGIKFRRCPEISLA
jgi:hypothetical protein